MSQTTITISGEGMDIIERLRAGMESRELIDLFGLKFVGVKLEAYPFDTRPHALMIAQEVTVVQPAPWPGDGLPPVGTICECHLPGELTREYSWVVAKVIWHNGPTECAVIRSSSKLAWCDEFRPIKTAAQIAADEREAGIQKMLLAVNPVGHLTGYTYQVVSCLYDAGMRLPNER